MSARAGSLASLLVAVAMGCGRDATPPFAPVPPLGPPPPLVDPPDRPTTPAKAELGRLLFFDRRLSGDLEVSCATCHDPARGWSDAQELSTGYPGTRNWRHAPTVVNAAWLPALLWDGTAPSLEAQARGAITGPLEGHGDPWTIEERLAEVPEYARRFREAFGAERPTFDLALQAVAAFERAAVHAADSPFDRDARGAADALAPAARRGRALFEGKAGCVGCHHGPLLTDGRRHVTGVPAARLFAESPLAQIALRFQHARHGVRGGDDLGAFEATRADADRGAFRTPPLRHLAHTAPYMHNGALLVLEEVIEFYDRGGGDVANRDALLRPLELTAGEKADLLAFLEGLSGPPVLMEPAPSPPYATGAPSVATALPPSQPPATAGALAARAPSAAPPAPARVALGRRLFFDPRLSGDATLSCATCHRQDRAFADGLPVSRAYPGAAWFRNTPSLLDAAARGAPYWDGRLADPDVAAAIGDHLDAPFFMNVDRTLLTERLRQVPAYVQAFREAFGAAPDAGSAVQALAAFCATLDSGDAPLDRHLRGDATALDPAAARGLALFAGRAGCAACHHGPWLSDGAFHRTEGAADPALWSVPERRITHRRFLRGLGVSDYATRAGDPGRAAVTRVAADDGKFRTPSLRNVALTAPYMHDGRFPTIEAVLASHAGGPMLAPAERSDILALLRTCTGTVPAVDPIEPSPYALLPAGH